jgi:glucosamine--fructose-6-phosphate aminotransferase (isomerizing)
MAPTSMLEQETAEQPDVLARLLETTWPQLDEIRAALRPERATGIVVAARGSSNNAGRYAQYLWGLRLGLPVTLATPSLYSIYDVAPRLAGQIVVAISQSGSSPDVVGVLAAARAQGSPTVAITNNPDSALAREATVVVPLHAGRELSVAATKTYTASLLAVALLAVALGDGDRDDLHRELAQVPGAAAATLAGSADLDDAASVLYDLDRAIVVGRGLNFGTAHEVSLKITELTGMLSRPFSPASLLHGPVAAVGPEVPVVLIAPHEPASSSVFGVMDHLRDRGAPLVLVAHPTGPGAEALAAADGPVPLPDLDAAPVAGWLTPLTAVLPGQLLAAHLAGRGVALNGGDIDHPAGLHKVTLTR